MNSPPGSTLGDRADHSSSSKTPPAALGPSTAVPVLQVQNLSKRYGSRIALEGVNLIVEKGVTGLLGPNGSGKSTLIKSLLGLVRTNSGTGKVLGYDWPSNVRPMRDRIGYLPEDDCYILGLQGIESVSMMAKLSGIPGAEAMRRAHEVLDFCDIGQERYRNVETYSTGMRQKLKFAQALVHDPELVILDEPTTGLDPSQREEFLSRIRTLATDFGKTVVLSTHILHDVNQICDHVVVLVRGRIKLASRLDVLMKPTQEGLHVQVVEHADRLVHAFRNAGYQVEAGNSRDLFVHGLTPASSRIAWELALQCGVMVQRVDQARNSLEDIFVRIVGDRDADS